MHPMLEEFCRAHPQNIRPEVFRRWQRIVRSEIGPNLQERDELIEKVAVLEATLAELASTPDPVVSADGSDIVPLPAKRRGRPPKNREAVTA